eukprot:CAMPEP_0171030942 /NCGR_PEP_ID=MMETSP0736-20130129/37336_1 /TAXON_ID=186038 /ORGANISM="Fragilariopsis kerguelensis, Strain L26-C5" /LENGTH=237 /DNA_ID=CAMNT_0011473081 /DNA_START=213 /DNA_END=924 /DNA_ORIENTATION=+
MKGSSSYEKQKRTKTQSAIIRYESIEVDEPNVVRYSAYYVGDNNENSSTGKTVSVTDWIELMSGQDSYELTTNLTEILRRSKFKAYRFETPGISSDTASNTSFEFVLVEDNCVEVKIKAYRFETPGISSDTASNTSFEFVLVEDNYLARFASTPDPNVFAEYLSPSLCNNNNNNDKNKQEQQQRLPPAGCVFENLGGDAVLVAPTDWELSSSSSSTYSGHLANFIRGASDEQIISLW